MKRILAITLGTVALFMGCVAARPQTAGAEKARELGVGWNLGNTLDAIGSSAGVETENSWGNPRTTQEMVNTVQAAGFRTLRIPITWNSHMGPEPDYTIDPAWLARGRRWWITAITSACMSLSMFTMMMDGSL